MIHRAVYRVETIIHHTPLRSDARFVENRPPSLNKRPTGRVHDRRVNYYCHESWSSSHRLIHIPISPERRPWVSILVPIPQMTPHWPRRRYPYCGPATVTTTPAVEENNESTYLVVILTLLPMGALSNMYICIYVTTITNTKCRRW